MTVTNRVRQEPVLCLFIVKVRCRKDGRQNPNGKDSSKSYRQNRKSRCVNVLGRRTGFCCDLAGQNSLSALPRSVRV